MDGSHSEFVFVENQRDVSPEPVDGWTVVQFAPDDSADPTTDNSNNNNAPGEPQTAALTEAALVQNDKEDKVAAGERLTDEVAARRAAEQQRLDAEREHAANERAEEEAEHRRREAYLEAIYLSAHAMEVGENEQRLRDEALMKEALKESEEIALLRQLQEELDAASAMRLVDTPASQGSDSGKLLRAADQQMEDLERFRRMQDELDDLSKQRLQERDTDTVIENLRRLQRELDEYSAQRFKDDSTAPGVVASDDLFRSAQSQPVAPPKCVCLGASKGFHRRDCPIAAQ